MSNDVERLAKSIAEQFRKDNVHVHDAPAAPEPSRPAAAAAASTPPPAAPPNDYAAKEQPQPPQKVHAVMSWMKKCPDCGADNLEYKKPTAFCHDCGAPQGSKEDAEKSAGCYACGGQKFKVKKVK